MRIGFLLPDVERVAALADAREVRAQRIGGVSVAVVNEGKGARAR